MFSTPPKGGALFVEPLEARIAPTNLIALANDPNDATVTSDPRYVTYHTPPTAGKLGFVAGATYGVAGSNVYALKLTKGDELLIFNSATGFNFNNPFLKDNNGSLVAFFQDSNNDGQVQSNELTGISLAGNTSAAVNGNVNGDIVTNLTGAGKVTLNRAGTLTQSIAGLNIVGNVTGSILSGGNINNVMVSGSVENVLAGSATNGAVYHFGGLANPSTGTLHATVPQPHHGGALIDHASFNSINVLRAGHGGFGAAGGAVSDVTLQSDTASFSIFSGPGGRGNAHTHAGAGGAITGVTVKGVTEGTANSEILIQSGSGGPDRAGTGGAGGSISGVAVGFDTPATSGAVPQISAVPLQDNIVLHAGNGGTARIGGVGGSVSDSFLFGVIPNDGVTINGMANPEIQVLAGSGGVAASASSGHGGSGGSINQVTAENLDTGTAAAASSILISAGTAGAGGTGGSVNGVTLLGKILTVQGGNGGAGLVSGGAGGSLGSVTIGNNAAVLSNPPVVLTSNLTLDAGFGGAGASGSGGNGGNISTVSVPDSALASLVIDGGRHGNGGVGHTPSGGVGGDGGSVTGLSINDSGTGSLGSVSIRTGTGGNGFLGGGAGGGLGSSSAAVSLLGVGFAYDVTTGGGGSLLTGGHGRGGAGGNFNSVGITNESSNAADVTLLTGATGTAIAGAGGRGSSGGRGGDLLSVDLRSAFSLALRSGDGGSGIAQAAGNGGIIDTSAGSSLNGSVTAVAGNAGPAGGRPGAGGSISAFVAAAAENVALTSGNGSFGGAGGNINGCGTALSELTGQANLGSLTVTAGRGSSANGVAGAGGSINVFNGSIGQSGITAFKAGAGGGGTHRVASGAGGAVTSVTLTGANASGTKPVFVTFDGGDAGQAGRALMGAAGGGVSNVTVSNLAVGTVVQHVAAGNGAIAINKGGAGGSISEIHVGAPGDARADIGVRSGLAYGYAVGTAGGLFAGVGGSGKVAGAAGDVTNITASAIASIAAGKAGTPHLAGTVDGIFLEGLVATVANANGAFANFGKANLVGSVINPLATNASTYVAGDGLIAAAVITNNRNFIPEAEETFNASGQLELVDYRQPSGVPVVTLVG